MSKGRNVPLPQATRCDPLRFIGSLHLWWQIGARGVLLSMCVWVVCRVHCCVGKRCVLPSKQCVLREGSYYWYPVSHGIQMSLPEVSSVFLEYVEFCCMLSNFHAFTFTSVMNPILRSFLFVDYLNTHCTPFYFFVLVLSLRVYNLTPYIIFRCATQYVVQKMLVSSKLLCNT